MATAARDRLARTLRGEAQIAFSVELTARTDDLSLEVEGFGAVKFPVTPAKARKLLGLGRPARFGRGEETLTDPDVRDAWEIPKLLVRAQWNDATLKDILATVKEALGLPNAAALTADLHALLVYETNQHFVAHQDSEKDDSMVGTLVVTLPSSYAAASWAWGITRSGRPTGGRRRALIYKAVRVGWAMTGGQDRAAAVRRIALDAAVRSDRICEFMGSTATPWLKAGSLQQPARRLLPSGIPPAPNVTGAGPKAGKPTWRLGGCSVTPPSSSAGAPAAIAGLHRRHVCGPARP